MNIIGPDALVFGVDDVRACSEFLTAFGLAPVGVSEKGGRFEALDGTSIVIRHKSDPSLPPALSSGTMLRQTIYGTGGEETLVEIVAGLGKDRHVHKLADGTIESTDDLGFALKFQLTQRRPLDLPGERVNAPGDVPGRGVNVLGSHQDMPARPRTLSHLVLFVPSVADMEAFYTKRLGFQVTDRLLNAGPFLKPQGTQDHHTLFMIQTPPYMQGCEHFAFHMGGPTEMMLAGSRFIKAGYQSFWGPGRHKFGSNWFWYFNSPLGCHIEYDADMDLHDESWVPREAPFSAEASQLFLFEHKEKWAPGGPPPGAGRPAGPA